MLYKEFRKKYSFTVSNYPETGNLFDRPLFVKVTTTNYSKSGSRWAAVSEDREDVSVEYYLNTLETVPFFRSLGGSERVEKKYTKYGYIPFRINSISPDRATKIVRKFEFV